MHKIQRLHSLPLTLVRYRKSWIMTESSFFDIHTMNPFRYFFSVEIENLIKYSLRFVVVLSKLGHSESQHVGFGKFLINLP